MDALGVDGFAVPVGIAGPGRPLKAPALDLARGFDPRTHDGARLAQPVVGQLLVLDRRHLDVDVDLEGRLCLRSISGPLTRFW
jgi:hypothetical protein